MPTDVASGNVASVSCPVDRSFIVCFPDPTTADQVQEIDLSPWRERPRLAVALRIYFETHMAGLTPLGRAGQLSSLNTFRDFVEEVFPSVTGLSNFTGFEVDCYKDWLDDQRHKRWKEGQPPFWTGNTKSIRFNALVTFLDFCWATPSLRAEMKPKLSFQRNPWPKSYRQTKHHQPISKVDLDKLRDACVRDMRETKRRLDLGAAIRADDTIAIPPEGYPSPKPYDDDKVRLRTLTERHWKRGPSHDRLKKLDPGLALSVLKSDGRGFEIASHLHLTARTLVPFVLLLAMDTAFNPDTILNIDLRDIEREHPLWGKERWMFGGEKGRAGRRQYRSFSSVAINDDSPVQILQTLERFGATARHEVQGPHTDRVFAFWQLRGKPFASFAGRTGYKTFKRAFDQFRRDHRDDGLPHFTLVTLRATMAEGIDRITDDPKAKQTLLGHRRLSTTLGYYDTKAAKRRRREALAVSVDLRERYARANGAADLRNRTPRADDPSAVTAGFGCTMPRFSPIKGQKKGQFCNAYGACPTCEQAYVDLNDALSYRRLLQLRDRIVEARSHAYSARWIEVWQPRLAALERRWLPRFPDDIAGRAMSLDVLPIPRVE